MGNRRVLLPSVAAAEGMVPKVVGGVVTWVNASDQDFLNGQVRQLGNVTAPIRTSIPREDAQSDVAAALATGVMTSVGVVLRAGDVVTNIAVQLGNTAGGSTISNWWFALYSNAATPALLAQTADQTNGALGANSLKDLALAAPVSITADGLYYVGIMVKAGTVPSLPCRVLARSTLSDAMLTGMAKRAVTSGSTLTDTAPATIATPTAVVNIPFVICH